MPIYEYGCPCGHTFEKVHGVNDPQPRKCPECGKLKLKKLFPSNPAVLHIRYSPMHPRHMRGQRTR